MGNLHLNTVPQNGTNSFTMMSVDEDNDHEPDYSLIYHHTGRSSITPIRFDFLNIPGTDDWYIVYHRINKSYLSNGPGYHREVCIDKLTFAEDGTINQVTPTHEGIAPVDVSALIEDLLTGIKDHLPSAICPQPSKSLYDLQGRMIETPTKKGIYITGGKKIFVK